VGLSDVAGVLSRKFIVGFLVPVFFATLALTLLVDDSSLPTAIREQRGSGRLLILGGFALLAGLLLWGLHYSLIRFLAGYWLVEPPRSDCRALARRINRARMSIGEKRKDHWIAERKRLVQIDQAPARSPERTRAARLLSSHFPPHDRLILPTELGNVIRAFETHPRTRYGLDGIEIWPRIATMLSESERAEVEDVTTDMAFWINSLFVTVVAGVLLFAEHLWQRPSGIVATAGVELAVVVTVAALAAWMYRQTIGAAIRWGYPVRAAFDVHRMEVYDALGVIRPLNASDDATNGEAVNTLLAFGDPVPDNLRVTQADR
jgi:hypothetical protein